MNELVNTNRKRGVLLKGVCAAMAAMLLGLWCNYAPAQAVDGSFTVVDNLIAETHVVVEKDGDNIAVATLYIDRIKNSSGDTQDIPGGIGAFSGTVDSGTMASALAVRSVSPYDGVSFDSGTGVFSVSGITGAPQPGNAAIAKIVVILTGDCLTPCSINISIDDITSAEDPNVHASEEAPNSLNFRRGDAQANSTVNIVDAMYIAQYTVGLRAFSALNGLNAASTKHDTGGDVLNIVDAMYIAQYTVSLRDENFNSN